MLTIRKPLLLGLLMAHGLVWAQAALRDPTTPPSGVVVPMASADKAQGDDSAMSAPRSSIRITPVGGRKQAVVDGRALQTGDQIKQWRLVSITANGVVLKDSRGTRTVPAPSSSFSKKPAAGLASEK